MESPPDVWRRCCGIVPRCSSQWLCPTLDRHDAVSGMIPVSVPRPIVGPVHSRLLTRTGRVTIVVNRLSDSDLVEGARPSSRSRSSCSSLPAERRRSAFTSCPVSCDRHWVVRPDEAKWIVEVLIVGADDQLNCSNQSDRRRLPLQRSRQFVTGFPDQPLTGRSPRSPGSYPPRCCDASPKTRRDR